MQVVVRYRFDKSDSLVERGAIEVVNTAVNPGTEKMRARFDGGMRGEEFYRWALDVEKAQAKGWGFIAQAAVSGEGVETFEDYEEWLQENVEDIYVEGMRFWERERDSEGGEQ